jgi:hypothetical protein
MRSLGKILFRGERKRRKTPVECDKCGRLICRNEYYRCTIRLAIDGRHREVIATRLCC